MLNEYCFSPGIFHRLHEHGYRSALPGRSYRMRHPSGEEDCHQAQYEMIQRAYRTAVRPFSVSRKNEKKKAKSAATPESRPYKEM